MGNYSLLVTMGALVVVSTFVVGSRASTHEADTRLGDHTFKNIAREATVTGMNMTLRRLVADTTSWAANPSKYGFTDHPYQDATFTTRVYGGYSSTEVIGRCVIDTVDVVSTSASDGGRTHELRATYVRTCSSPDGIPPFFKYVTIADRDLNIAGFPNIRSTDPTSNADVHTNMDLNVTAAPIVEGFGSYVEGYKCVGSSCDGFMPNHEPAGSGEDNVVQRGYIDLPPIIPSEYLPLADYVSPATVELADVTLDFTRFALPGDAHVVAAEEGLGTERNPFVWYIKGDLEILKKTDVRVVGYGIIVTEGSVHVNASANLYSSVPDGVYPPDPNDVDAMREFYKTYMPNDLTLAIYSAGDIHLNGQNSMVMATMYANNSIHVNGLQNVIGSMATRSEMKFNGSDVNIWYAGVNSSVILPGLEIILPDGIRMIAYAEW
jgi:hypothetical protein